MEQSNENTNRFWKYCLWWTITAIVGIVLFIWLAGVLTMHEGEVIIDEKVPPTLNNF